MLDMFPSVETVTPLNNFVQDTVVTKEITESTPNHNTQNTKSNRDLEELDENVGRNINIQI